MSIRIALEEIGSGKAQRFKRGKTVIACLSKLLDGRPVGNIHSHVFASGGGWCPPLRRCQHAKAQGTQHRAFFLPSLLRCQILHTTSSWALQNNEL